jgi:hypothetical protein
MATFILIPGAGGAGWYWHLVVPLLRAAGHDAIAVDLPADDQQAGLATYADRAIDAIDGRKDIVLVAWSPCRSVASRRRSSRSACRSVRLCS